MMSMKKIISAARTLFIIIVVVLISQAVCLPTDTDTTVSNKENVADSALVAVPISQVTCEGDNYTAVIEGFRPRLVSIDIIQQTQYIETTKTIPPKKWSFGLTLGASAGVFYTPKGIQPGAGLGATLGVTYHF